VCVCVLVRLCAIGVIVRACVAQVPASMASVGAPQWARVRVLLDGSISGVAAGALLIT
jgi:hypothetical protein